MYERNETSTSNLKSIEPNPFDIPTLDDENLSDKNKINEKNEINPLVNNETTISNIDSVPLASNLNDDLLLNNNETYINQSDIEPESVVNSSTNEIPSKEKVAKVLFSEETIPVSKKSKKHNKQIDDDNWDDEPKKKGGHKILITILILLILGLGGYILYDKVLINYINPKEEVVKEEPKKEVEPAIVPETTLLQDIELGKAYQIYEEIIAMHFEGKYETEASGEDKLYTINEVNYRKPLDQSFFQQFTPNAKQQLIDSGTFIEQDGVIYQVDADRGMDMSYSGTVLTLTSNEDIRYEYLATSYYCEGGITTTTVKKDCTIKENKFIIVDKKIEDFTLPC